MVASPAGRTGGLDSVGLNKSPRLDEPAIRTASHDAAVNVRFSSFMLFCFLLLPQHFTTRKRGFRNGSGAAPGYAHAHHIVCHHPP
jgi:hypothetical protein